MPEGRTTRSQFFPTHCWAMNPASPALDTPGSPMFAPPEGSLACSSALAERREPLAPRSRVSAGGGPLNVCSGHLDRLLPAAADGASHQPWPSQGYLAYGIGCVQHWGSQEAPGSCNVALPVCAARGSLPWDSPFPFGVIP